MGFFYFHRAKMSGLSTGQVKRATVHTSTSGVTQLVAGVAGKTIRVHSLAIAAASAVNVTVEDSTGTPVVLLDTCPIATAALVLPLAAYECPWFSCSVGKDLQANLSGSVATTFLVIYTVDG